ncbi:energy-dependent translational throttle protein EttA [bacterium]|nr:MAG: energy-dependent translational throttle protein EttA [bacterium]
MAPQYIYTMHGLVKVVAGTEKILDGIYLSFYPGAKIGVVGENGSGKSTLLKIMAGVDQDFIGHSEPAKGVRIGYVPQEPVLDASKTVYENVEMAFTHIKEMLTEYDRLAEDMADPDKMEEALEKMGELQEKIEQVDGWNLEHKIKVASEALLLPESTSDVTKLSGGERRRVALCKALLEQPDILLLDEPTNHLDAETVQWLEKQLQEYPGTVIIVTHDRYFLDNVTKWILELENGKGTPYEGNYSGWLEQKIAKLDKSEKNDSFRLQTLKREFEWIKLNQKERKIKNQSHVTDYYKRVDSSSNSDVRTNGITIAPGPRLGDLVLEMTDVSKGYDSAELIKDMELNLSPGSIVGVIGPNGVGKSTLFEMITGLEKPDSGVINLGPTVEVSYVDQHRDLIDDGKTVFQAVCDGIDTIKIGSREVNSRDYLGKFGFRGKDQQKLIKVLSGGERNRAYLSKLLRKGGNFILLDEPSNDLDITTLRMLENALLDFNGCVMVISHDRFFLDRICTHILAFEGQGKVRYFEGNFQEYESARRKELGSDYDKGRSSRYKKLKL